MADQQSGISTLTAIAPIKAGSLDSLRQALKMVAAANPSPIEKVATVHCARWVIFDNDSRLLFTADFDGTWDEYVDDFIDNAPQGLDLVFGHCEGYPAGGAQDREAFKQYVRDHQVDLSNVTAYCAYPDSSVRDIQKASRIRKNFEALLDDFQ